MAVGLAAIQKGQSVPGYAALSKVTAQQRLRFSSGTATLAPSFGQQGTAQAVFNGSCESGSDCDQLNGLAMRYEEDAIIALPSGSARSATLSFPMTASGCVGAGCADYADFAQATGALPAGVVTFHLQLQFHEDGWREATCDVSQIDVSYLRKTGWTRMRCASAQVAGWNWW